MFDNYSITQTIYTSTIYFKVSVTFM